MSYPTSRNRYSCRGNCESCLSLELELCRLIPRFKSGQNKIPVLNPFYVLGRIPPRSLHCSVRECVGCFVLLVFLISVLIKKEF